MSTTTNILELRPDGTIVGVTRTEHVLGDAEHVLRRALNALPAPSPSSSPVVAEIPGVFAEGAPSLYFAALPSSVSGPCATLVVARDVTHLGIPINCHWQVVGTGQGDLVRVPVFASKEDSGLTATTTAASYVWRPPEDAALMALMTSTGKFFFLVVDRHTKAIYRPCLPNIYYSGEVCMGWSYWRDAVPSGNDSWFSPGGLDKIVEWFHKSQFNSDLLGADSTAAKQLAGCRALWSRTVEPDDWAPAPPGVVWQSVFFRVGNTLSDWIAEVVQ